MSMLYAQAIKALGDHLKTFTRGGQVVLAGEVFSPAQDRGYVRGRFAAYTRNPAGFGADSVYLENGTYEVSICRPGREGELPAAQLAVAVAAHFARGSGLVLGTGEFLHFENVSAFPAIIAGDWLTVPVVISWFCTDP